MNSAISTEPKPAVLTRGGDDASALRPWHFFVLAALMAATAAVVLSREAAASRLILTSLAIGAAALTGLGMFRTLWPLASPEFAAPAPLVGGRTREAIAREKTLVLRSIKELEFDYAMGKVSAADFDEMGSRLRARAMNLMRQLDDRGGAYRALIERDVKVLARAPDARRTPDAAPRAAVVAEPAPAVIADAAPEPATVMPAPTPARAEGPRSCAGCQTANDADARFCKNCGMALAFAEDETANAPR
jgi:hypothetical protein